MTNTELNRFARVSVIFEKRSDGGLRIYSDDVPGFILSSLDEKEVLEDVTPALEEIITKMVGQKVTVRILAPLPEFNQKKRLIPEITDQIERIDYFAAAA